MPDHHRALKQFVAAFGPRLSQFQVTHPMTHPKYVLMAAVLLAACGSDRSSDAGSAPDSATAAAAATDTVARGSRPERGATTIVLAPDGLTITAGAGEPKRVTFDLAQEEVLADVGPILGAPREQGLQEECPAGPLYQVLYAAGLQLVFQDDKFAGWAARQGSTLRLEQGVGPGSTVGELKEAFPAATVEESSLGHEFAAGDLYGVVTGPSEAGKVEIMFAGTNCIFR
jgi:hypothetical protein